MLPTSGQERVVHYAYGDGGGCSAVGNSGAPATLAYNGPL